jgi:hypothetical protein
MEKKPKTERIKKHNEITEDTETSSSDDETLRVNSPSPRKTLHRPTLAFRDSHSSSKHGSRIHLFPG